MPFCPGLGLSEAGTDWFHPVPAAAEASALPLVLPEPGGDPGGDGVRAHLLEEQGPDRRDPQRQPGRSSFREGANAQFTDASWPITVSENAMGI